MVISYNRLVLPENCIFGITKGCYTWLTQTVGEANSYCEKADASCDIYLTGSFCPIESGMYTIYSTGTIQASWDRYFSFDGIERGLNTNFSVVLHANKCYPFSLVAAASLYAEGSISIQRNGGIQYYLNSTESITCSFNGCLNGGETKNNCVDNTTQCAMPKYNPTYSYILMIFCFLTSS